MGGNTTSPLNMMWNPFRKGLSKGRFRGKMNCPFCSKHADPTTTPIGFETDKTKIKLWDNIGPFMREYRCMSCGGRFRYDIREENRHPYDSFKRGLKLPGLGYNGRVPLINK